MEGGFDTVLQSDRRLRCRHSVSVHLHDPAVVVLPSFRTGDLRDEHYVHHIVRSDTVDVCGLRGDGVSDIGKDDLRVHHIVRMSVFWVEGYAFLHDT